MMLTCKITLLTFGADRYFMETISTLIMEILPKTWVSLEADFSLLKLPNDNIANNDKQYVYLMSSFLGKH